MKAPLGRGEVWHIKYHGQRCMMSSLNHGGTAMLLWDFICVTTQWSLYRHQWNVNDENICHLASWCVACSCYTAYGHCILHLLIHWYILLGNVYPRSPTSTIATLQWLTCIKSFVITLLQVWSEITMMLPWCCVGYMWLIPSVIMYHNREITISRRRIHLYDGFS